MDNKEQQFTRRHFLQNTAKLSLALPFLGSGLMSFALKRPGNKAVEPLKILILGGTSFLGPHIIKYALDRGHSITTFTRGKTKPTVHDELFQQVTSLIGDRKDNLKALEKGSWDLVIDNSGYSEEWTKASANLLKDRAKLYLYTSSISVYYPFFDDEFKEDHRILLEAPKGIEDEDLKKEYWYGVMKANSEIEAKKAFGPERTIIIRPTFMIGPGDKSDRFIHWPVRLAKGGEVLVPGKKEDPVQFIDVRDVSEWMVRLAENQITGAFNASGPKVRQHIYDFVREAATAFDNKCQFTYIADYKFLKNHNVHYLVPWVMPEGNDWGLSRASNEKAKANGLTYRPLRVTTKDTYDWWMSKALSQERRDKFEKHPEGILMRESTILEAWKERK